MTQKNDQVISQCMCGGKAAACDDMQRFAYFVKCARCDLEGIRQESESAAISMWNRGMQLAVVEFAFQSSQKR